MPKISKTKRCDYYVKDKKTKKQRRCKKKITNNKTQCNIHYNLNNNFNNNFNNCCFCDDICDYQSQSCGQCARLISLYALKFL